MKRSTENLRHTRWECKYHVVFIPKYRKRSIYGWVRRGISSHFSQRDHIEGCKRRECFHLDNPGGSALLSRRQTGNWTPMATIRLCTSQCPIRRGSYSLVADSADNPQISAA